jgi:hypothetical protein
VGQVPATLTAHPKAVSLTVDTFLNNIVDAQAEADRYVALYSVRRDLFSFPSDRARADYQLGDTVNLTAKRFGLSGGKNLLVVARKDDFDADTVELSLWG